MSKPTIILSLESAGNICSASISINNVISATFSVYLANKHDKLLAEFAKRLLNDLDISITELDAVAVSAGPGSFTGLRISGSIAKAMCFGGTPNLIAVPNLMAFAYNCYKNINNNVFLRNSKENNTINKIIATIKAQKDLLYFQEFSNEFIALNEPKLVAQDYFQQNDASNSIFCGSAAYLFPKYNIDINSINFSAELISNLANEMLSKGEFTSPDEYTPMYFQDFNPKKI